MPKNKLDNIRTALSYDDVLLVPQYSEISSRTTVDLSTNITNKIKLKIPVISINMDDVTGVEMAIAMSKNGGLGFLPRFDTPEIQADKVSAVKRAGGKVGAAIGVKNGYLKRAELLLMAGADVITLDIAHGHMQKALDITSDLKNKFGEEIQLIQGVVASYQGAKNLFIAGADAVRVGIGPGTICTTRIVTGFGVPQVTAITEAARAAREYGRYVLADGGTKNSGDIVKGLACGASASIVGSQLAGTDEAPGKLIEINGKKYKEYNAETSKKSKNRQINKDRTNKEDHYINHVEGVEAYVPYKGSVEEVLTQMIAGVRSGLSYAGAKNITKLWKNAEFIRVTASGNRENGAHDVILKEQLSQENQSHKPIFH